MADLEIAIDSADDGKRAFDAGADRLEVCSDLDAGGCTPDANLFDTLRSFSPRPLFVMLRPRAGSFVYTAEEKRAMLNSLKHFLSAGADGYVVGALTRDGILDEGFLREVIDAAGGHPCTFHRAFDAVTDPDNTLELICEMRMSRILTSGGAANAEEGIDRIRSLTRRAGDRLCIVPGGGVRPSNIGRILHDTGATEIHSSGRDESGRLDANMVRLLAGIAHATH